MMWTQEELSLPPRKRKPRASGLTVVIDNGAPTGYFEDVVASASDHIDMIKFGWGTALVTADLERKIACLRAHEVEYFFGGTLFEKYYSQGKVDAFHDFERLGIEIFPGGENPRPRRLDRAAGVEMHLGMDVERLVGGHDRNRRLVHAAIQHQPERAVGAVLREKNHGLREIGIDHLRH